jgi:hypothetical protein
MKCGMVLNCDNGMWFLSKPPVLGADLCYERCALQLAIRSMVCEKMRVDREFRNVDNLWCS